MNLREEALKLRTRRQLFKDSVTGLGAIALASLLDAGPARPRPIRARRSPARPKPPHFTPRARNIIYLHMAGARRRSTCSTTSPGSTSSTARSAPIRTSGGSSSRSSRGSHAAGLAAPVRASGRVGPGDVGHPAAPGDGGRRHRGRPLDVHRPVQPRPGAVVRPHRLGAAGSAEHGLVAVVRAGDGEPRPAELRRPGIGHRARRTAAPRSGAAPSCRRSTRGCNCGPRAIRCSSSPTPPA